jgi:hypothetical protein
MGLWRRYINATIKIPGIVHRPVFYLKRPTGFVLGVRRQRDELCLLGPTEQAPSEDGDKSPVSETLYFKQKTGWRKMSGTVSVILQNLVSQVRELTLGLSRSAQLHRESRRHVCNIYLREGWGGFILGQCPCATELTSSQSIMSSHFDHYRKYVIPELGLNFTVQETLFRVARDVLHVIFDSAIGLR